LNPEKKLSGEISLIGDKSISHRSIIFGSIAEGVSEFSNVLISGDTTATIEIFNSLGVNIEVKEHNTLVIHGVGLNGLSKSKQALDAKSSGTTARLLTGLLARQNFSSELIGSSQLSKRPMGRVINLLTEHGSGIKSNEGYLPIEFEQTESAFNAINTIVPSAQVKSALIIASLYHQEPTVIREDIPTRDHTERMLSHMGVGLVRMGSSITVPPNQILKPTSFRIPSDISSAAFLIAIGILSSDKIVLNKVLINERRIGFLKILKRMNANITISNITEVGNELIGDIEVIKSELIATQIEPDEIPDLIDEIPLLTFLASQAEGETTLRGAEELRIKESDRLESMKEFIQTLN
jgi:3-phosphoshikimate 1-carboxyvinyltransferase